MRKYVDHMTIGMKEQLVYPGAVWAGLFSKVLYLYLQFCIWKALFSDCLEKPTINRTDTLRYIIIATIVSTIMECNVTEKINAQIQSGNIAIELIRPIGFKRMLFARHVGDTAVKMICCTLPLIVLTTVTMQWCGADGLRLPFLQEWSAGTGMQLMCIDQLGYGILSLFLAYGIQFLYSLIIGLLAFWLIVTWPVNMFLGAVYRLLSGVWIPVTLFPELLYRINLWLPFRAVYAIPVSILTTEMKRKVIWQSVSVQMVWLVILYGFSLFLWRVGRKKLVVQGG